MTINSIINIILNRINDDEVKNICKEVEETRKSIRFSLKRIKKQIQEEEQVIIDRDPAIKEKKEVLLYPSFRAMIYYRIAHKIYNNGHYFIARFISQIATRRTGIEIHPGATIGHGLFIDHGAGVIIGETTIIGNNVTIYQGVTLGGTGKDKGKRHPNIEDDCMIGAGARVLGPLTLGKGTKVGAGAVILHSTPPYCTVVGVPGRIVKSNDEVNPRDKMDQIHLPDPVLQDIINIKSEIEQLKKENKALKASK